MSRFVDICVAVAALTLLSPLLILTALVIVATSRGGVFYRGWRVGQYGRPFRMWKFRTMGRDAAKKGCITGRKDPRVTLAGRILRKTKVDELPQFINLLTGDMTLVGPRPESPEIVAHYTPEQRAVLAVKPGITGQGQIAQDDESELIPEDVDASDYYLKHLMDRKVQRDLAYLSQRTPLTDVRIVLATANLVLRAMIRR